MHIETMKFIEEFERNAKQSGQFRNKLGKHEVIALEQVLGPALQYRFEGLHAEYPYVDAKGGQRFIDFVYVRGGLQLIIEIDGFTTHARNISYQEFDDHLARQNDLVLSGWVLLRFSANQVEHHPKLCSSMITQAIGHWWSLAHGGLSEQGGGVWSIRKRLVIELALRHDGRICSKDVVAAFKISPRTALNWLKRFVEEEVLIPIHSQQRIIGFQLKVID